MQFSRSRSKFSRLSFERLENRLTLDGNVFAQLKGSTLQIIGDSLDNSVEINYVAPTSIRVVGNSNTKINGTIGGISIDLANFRAGTFPSLSVKTSDGADFVRIAGVRLKDLTVNLGNGQDMFIVHAINVSGKASIVMGTDSEVDDDHLEMRDHPKFAGNVDIKFGAGNDYFRFFDEGITVNKDLTIDLGDGQDSGRVDESHIAGNVKFDLGDDANSLYVEQINLKKSLTVEGGSGRDSVQFVDWVEASKVTIKLYEGDDFLHLDGVARSLIPPVTPTTTYADSITIDLGDGDDTMQAEGAYAKKVDILLGNGNNSASLTSYQVGLAAKIVGGTGRDKVDFLRSTADTLTGTFGDGDDTLNTTSSRVNRLLSLKGGKGTNILYKGGLVQPRDPKNVKIDSFQIRS